MDDKNIVQCWRVLLQAIKKQKGLLIDVDYTANLITYLATFIPMRGWNLGKYSTEYPQEQLIASVLSLLGIDQQLGANK